MGSDPPNNQLTSSQVIHDMSLSPKPVNQSTLSLQPDSPEPLSEEDIIRMRNRASDLGLSLDAKSPSEHASGNLTLKEKELGSMVVTLLQSSIDPTQLHRQAEFITWLGIQRDFLVQSFKEERRRWEAEKEGWARMAEALLSQCARAANSSRNDEEVERKCAAYESENKNLREKLHESHSRFSALESELNRLKPLLFMQPPSPFSSLSSERTPVSKANISAEPGSSKVKRKPLDSSAVPEEHNHGGPAIILNEQGTSHSHSLLTPDAVRTQPRADHYRRHSRSRSFLSPLHSRISSNSTPARSIFSAIQSPLSHTHSWKKSRSKSKKFHSNLPPLTADARTEHLLLAARKIGRDRANAVSGFMRRIEKEREDLAREQEAECLDREHLDTTAVIHPGSNAYYRKDLLDFVKSPGSSALPAIPKTPKRGANGTQSSTDFLTSTLVTPRSDFHPTTNQTPNSFVFVGAPAITSYQVASTPTPRPTDRPTLMLHSTTKSAQTPAGPSTSNHPTPLASLLSAAKSMMDDDANESNPTPTGRRRGGIPEPPESPLPKRRRVGNGNTSNGKAPTVLSGVSMPASDRVRSALDVLADQAAAAFDSDWQSPTKPPTKPISRTKGKDKGVFSRSVLSEDVFNDNSTPNGKISALNDPPPQTSTGSPVSRRSRSKVKLTDRLSKGVSKAPRKRKDKSLDSQQRSTPAPRMIFSPGSRSPVPPPSPPPASSPMSLVDIALDNPSTDPIPAHTEFEIASKSLADNGSPRLPNGVASRHSKSPVSSSMRQRSLAKSSSPSLEMTDKDARGPQPNETGTTQTDIEAPVTKNSTTPVAAIDQLKGGIHVPGAVMTEDRDERVEVQLHSDRLQLMSDEDEHDTDADAEGEVDLDAEGTVIMNLSSMTHESLSLAVPQSQPGTSHPNAGGMATNEQRLETPQGFHMQS